MSAAADPTERDAIAGSGFIAFRSVDFRYHCIARVLSGLAVSMLQVAVGWYVYSITGSAFALGLSGLASFMPSVFFALFTGHVADTHRRKIVVGVSFLICAAASFCLFEIAWLRFDSLPAIYACIVLIGSARAFANTASQALTPNLVPLADLPNAVTWFTSSWSAAFIVGPALGGVLYVFGARWVFACATAGFAIAGLSMFAIRYVQKFGAVRARVSWETLSAGLRFIRSREVIFGAITLDLVAVLFGGATALMPMVAKDLLHSGPWALGLLRASPAAGSIVMALFLAHAPIRAKAGLKMLVAVLVFGAAVIGFGLSTNLALSMVLLVILGAADQISMVVRHTLVQCETPDDMRGRVSAVNAIFVGATNDLGEFESGLAAAALGLVPAILAGGAMTIIVAICWAAMFPALRRRNKLIES